MFKFPERTYFNKRIPKQKFYEKLKVNRKLERQFTNEIESIYWKNKLSPETLNVEAGEQVKEIEIFEINLKERKISNNIIEIIDREIPYHIVFVLRYKDLVQLWISYKESSKNRDGKFKVDSYYHTKWEKLNNVTLSIEGLTLDKIYENFLFQIAGGKLQLDDGADLKEAVTKAKAQDKLQAQIQKLEHKIANEKQFNRQVKLMGELREAKNQLESSL